MIEISTIKEYEINDLAELLEELSDMKTDIHKMHNNYKLISENGNYILLGAKYSNKLVGSLMGIICHDLVGDCKPFIVVENVIVSSIYRGKGIGKLLMIEIEKIAKERDCYYAMFISGFQRTDAHKFYESIGYKQDTVKGFKKYL